MQTLFGIKMSFVLALYPLATLFFSPSHFFFFFPCMKKRERGPSSHAYECFYYQSSKYMNLMPSCGPL